MLEAAVLNVVDHAEQIALAEAFVRRRHDDARLRVPLTKLDRETLQQASEGATGHQCQTPCALPCEANASPR
jgi:hypothetical protein